MSVGRKRIGNGTHARNRERNLNSEGKKGYSLH